MKRLLPFFLATLGVVLSLGLLTAYRSGLFARIAEFARPHTEEVVLEVPEIV